jgi:hypothetical protein
VKQPHSPHNALVAAFGTAQVEARLEASKKRNAEQATELGKSSARIESMQGLLKDKDEFVSNYRSMIDTQTSQLSALQVHHYPNAALERARVCIGGSTTVSRLL